MPAVIRKIIEVYISVRQDDEAFIDCVHRVGIEPFKNTIYQETAH